MGNKQWASGQLGCCAALLCLFAGMMIGSVDTAGFICGVAGLLCASLTQFIYQVPGCVSSAWQGEEDFVHRRQPWSLGPMNSVLWCYSGCGLDQCVHRTLACL